jgi:hypothetical protein
VLAGLLVQCMVFSPPAYSQLLTEVQRANAPTRHLQQRGGPSAGAVIRSSVSEHQGHAKCGIHTDGMKLIAPINKPCSQG